MFLLYYLVGLSIDKTEILISFFEGLHFVFTLFIALFVLTVQWKLNGSSCISGRMEVKMEVLSISFTFCAVQACLMCGNWFYLDLLNADWFS